MKQTEEFRPKNVTAAREKIPALQKNVTASRENVAAPLRNLSYDYLLHAFGESHVSADALCSQLGIIAVEADERGVWESCSHLFEWETDDDGRVETYTKLQEQEPLVVSHADKIAVTLCLLMPVGVLHESIVTAEIHADGLAVGGTSQRRFMLTGWPSGVWGISSVGMRQSLMAGKARSTHSRF